MTCRKSCWRTGRSWTNWARTSLSLAVGKKRLRGLAKRLRRDPARCSDARHERIGDRGPDPSPECSAHTPIIFLTAFADEVHVAEGYAQGAVDYITTPVVPAVLCAKVRVFCDLYRMSQKVLRQAEERIVLAEERSKREAAEEANRRLAFLPARGKYWGNRSTRR